MLIHWCFSKWRQVEWNSTICFYSVLQPISLASCKKRVATVVQPLRFVTKTFTFSRMVVEVRTLPAEDSVSSGIVVGGGLRLPTLLLLQRHCSRATAASA